MSLPATGTPGTPRLYDRDRALRMLEALADGLSLEEAGEIAGIKPSTFARWAYEDSPKGMAQAYQVAKQIGVETKVSEIFAIADDTSRDVEESEGEKGTTRFNTNAPARDRIRIDTRKWYVSKVAPKLYGDKIEVEHTGTGGGVSIQVVTGIPGPPGELLGEPVDAEFEEVKPKEDVEDLL